MGTIDVKALGSNFFSNGPEYTTSFSSRQLRFAHDQRVNQNWKKTKKKHFLRETSFLSLTKTSKFLTKKFFFGTQNELFCRMKRSFRRLSEKSYFLSFKSTFKISDSKIYCLIDLSKASDIFTNYV